MSVSFIAGAGAGAELLGGLEMLALSLLETALKSIESAVPIEWSIVWRIGTGRIRMAIIANMNCAPIRSSDSKSEASLGADQ